ncbi:hypothetical protein BGZ58_007434 [Dissophora ornata]|nr:hypothetical protein BGZ58_007434 [Dissophora ornata]
MEQSDQDLARLLQEQEYAAAAGAIARQGDEYSGLPIIIPEDDNDNSELNLDAQAPFKDLHGLFLAFNDQYFGSKLSACEVRWSPRMTRCAGLCLYQARAQYCSIRLSEPLLKFRPESDYIDTLLHEMIHAYLFVTKAIQDHDGHGADFQHHMNRINEAAGTTITIYHTFHDEVRYYQTHVWKCNGPCQQCPPYYGIVKRSMNRPPQPADRWFAEHQKTCGGTYTKISEPEPTTKKSSSKSQKNAKTEPEAPRGRTLLDDFFSVSKTPAGTASKSSSLPLSTPPPQAPRNAKEPSGGSPSVKQEVRGSSNSKGALGETTIDTIRADADLDLTIPRLSPREAAAAAALARFERQLKASDANALSSAGPSSAKSKRKGPDNLHNIKDEGETLKKVKAEEMSTVKKESRNGAIKEIDVRIKTEDQDQGLAATIVDPEDQEHDSQAVPIKKSKSSDAPATATTSFTAFVQCPVCSRQVEESTINDHVDLCIWRTSGETD